jgi:hypothetical protein
MKRLSVVGAQACCAHLGRRSKSAPLPGAGLRFPASGCWLLFFGLQFSILNLPASPPAAAPQDLGRGLIYVRLQRLPDDAALLTTVWNAPALIIDLRHPAGATAHAIPADLPSRPRTAPLLMLVGPGTPTDLLAVLRDHAPAFITIGLAAPGLTPDIVLSVNPEADARAYAALEAGASVNSLISENTYKHRFDEAALARDRDAGETEDEGPKSKVEGREDAPPTAAAAPAPIAAKSAPPAMPLKDTVLERAVQLHRALLALGKLPRS